MAAASGAVSAAELPIGAAERSDRVRRPQILPDGTVIFEVHDYQTGERFQVATHCPLYSGRHPRAGALRAGHREWARRHDLFADADDYERFCAAGFDVLVSAQCHRLSLTAALVVSHFMSWVFVFDDAQEQRHASDPAGSETSRREIARHVAILDGDSPRAGDSQVVFAFADFVEQASALGSGPDDAWHERMVGHVRDYVVGTWCEAIVAAPAAFNTALHWQVRGLTVGVLPGCDLSASALRLPSAFVLKNAFVQRLDQLCINHQIWINDLLGLNRDQRSGGANTLLVLRSEQGLSLKQVARMTARHCDQELRAFAHIEREMPRLLGKDWPAQAATITAYTEVLKNSMRGHVDWSVVSDRYNSDADTMLKGR